MKKCKKCGYEIDDKWKCCPKCGNTNNNQIARDTLITILIIAVVIFIEEFPVVYPVVFPVFIEPILNIYESIVEWLFLI